MEHAHVTLQEFSLPHQARYQINVSLTSSEPQHGHLMAEQYPEIKINTNTVDVRCHKYLVSPTQEARDYFNYRKFKGQLYTA